MSAIAPNPEHIIWGTVTSVDSYANPAGEVKRTITISTATGYERVRLAPDSTVEPEVGSAVLWGCEHNFYDFTPRDSNERRVGVLLTLRRVLDAAALDVIARDLSTPKAKQNA